MPKAPELCPIEECLKPFYREMCEEIARKAAYIRDTEERAETVRTTMRRIRKHLKKLRAMSEEARSRYLARAIKTNRLQVLRNQGTHHLHVVYVETRTLDLLAPSVPDDSGKIEAEDALEKALAKLTELERRVFALVYDEGWTKTAIAAHLGTSVANVTQTIGRAEGKIRRFLE